MQGCTPRTMAVLFLLHKFMMCFMKKAEMETVKINEDYWVHRSKNMRCNTCMYFLGKPLLEAQTNNIGRCRRHAPTMSGFPVMFGTDIGCGDHKLDENKL